MRTLVIDSHLHLFDASKGHYHWWSSLPDTDQRGIAKSFSVNDLRLPPHLSLGGIVHIEAGYDNEASWHEIDNVEARCEGVALASIGCTDLTMNCDDFKANLREFKKRASFRGLRHILDENALAVLRHHNTIANLKILIEENHIFELQVSLIDKTLNSGLFGLLERIPQLKFAINHAGFAPFSQHASCEDNQIEQWRSAISQLAAFPNSVIKCSGWEMQDRAYNTVAIIPFIAYLNNAFGEDRLLFSSNFPLTLFSKNYSEYWSDMMEVITALGLDPTKVLYENTKKFYRFS